MAPRHHAYAPMQPAVNHAAQTWVGASVKRIAPGHARTGMGATFDTTTYYRTQSKLVNLLHFLKHTGH